MLWNIARPEQDWTAMLMGYISEPISFLQQKDRVGLVNIDDTELASNGSKGLAFLFSF
jgi:hypothetical protein